MSKLLPSVTAPGTATEEESQRRTATGTDDTGDGTDDAGGSRWRRRAVYAAGGLGAVLVYRRLRGRKERNADVASADDPAGESKTGRSLKRRLGGRAGRLAVGFVAASAAKRLLRRRQR